MQKIEVIFGRMTHGQFLIGNDAEPMVIISTIEERKTMNPDEADDYMTAQGGKLGAADVTGTLRDDRTEVAALHVLHDEVDDVVVAAGGVDRDDVRRLDQAGGTRLDLEACTLDWIL